MDHQHQWNAMLQDMFCRIYNTQHRNSYETGVYPGEQNGGEHYPNTTFAHTSASRRLPGPAATVTSLHDSYNKPALMHTKNKFHDSYNKTMELCPASTDTSLPDSYNKTETVVTDRVSTESTSSDFSNGPKMMESDTAKMMASDTAKMKESDTAKMMESDTAKMMESDTAKMMESDTANTVTLLSDSFKDKTETVLMDCVSAKNTSHNSFNELKTMETCPGLTDFPDSYNTSETVVIHRVSTANTSQDSPNEPKATKSGPTSTVTSPPGSYNATDIDRPSTENTPHASSYGNGTLGSAFTSIESTQFDPSNESKTYGFNTNMSSNEISKDSNSSDKTRAKIHTSEISTEETLNTNETNTLLSSAKAVLPSVITSDESSVSGLSPDKNETRSNQLINNEKQCCTSNEKSHFPEREKPEPSHNHETNTAKDVRGGDYMDTTRNENETPSIIVSPGGKTSRIALNKEHGVEILSASGEHRELDKSVRSTTYDADVIIPSHDNASLGKNKSLAAVKNKSKICEAVMNETSFTSTNDRKVSDGNDAESPDISTPEKTSGDLKNEDDRNLSNDNNWKLNDSNTTDCETEIDPTVAVQLQNVLTTKSKTSDNLEVKDDSSINGMTIQDNFSDMLLKENYNNVKTDSLLRDETSQLVSNECKVEIKADKSSVASVTTTIETNNNYDASMYKNEEAVASKSDGLTGNKIMSMLQNNDDPKEDALKSLDQTSSPDKTTDAINDDVNIANSATDEGKYVITSSNENQVTELTRHFDAIVNGKTSNNLCNHDIVVSEMSYDDRNDVLSYACKMADIPTSEDEMQDVSSNGDKTVVSNDKITVETMQWKVKSIMQSSCRAKISKQDLKSINKLYRCCYCMKEFRKNRNGYLLFRKHKKAHEKRYFKSWHKICQKKKTEMHKSSNEKDGDSNVTDEIEQNVGNADQKSLLSHETPNIPPGRIVREENSILFRLLQKPNKPPEKSTSSDIVSKSPGVQIDCRRSADRIIPATKNSSRPLDPYQQTHQAHLNQTSWYGQPRGVTANQSPVNPFVSYASSHSTGVNPMTSWAAAQTAATFLANSFDPSHPMTLSPGSTWPLSHIVAYNLFATSYPHLPMALNSGNPGAPPYSTVNSVNHSESSRPSVNQINTSEQSHPSVVNPAINLNQATVMNTANNPAAMSLDIGASYLQNILSANRDNPFAPSIPVEVNQHVPSDNTILNNSLQAAVNPAITSNSNNTNYVQPSAPFMPNANYVDCGNVIVNIDDPDASLHNAVYYAIEGALPQTTVENPVTSSAMSYTTVNPGLPSDQPYSTTINSFMESSQPCTTETNSVNSSAQYFARNITSATDSLDSLPFSEPVTVNTTPGNPAALSNSLMTSNSMFLPHSVTLNPVISTAVDSVIQNLLPQSTAVEHINTTTVNMINSAIPNIHPEFTSAPPPVTGTKHKKRRKISRKQNLLNPGNLDSSNRYVCYSCQISLPDDSTWRTHMLSHSVFKNHTKRGRPKNAQNNSN